MKNNIYVYLVSVRNKDAVHDTGLFLSGDEVDLTHDECHAVWYGTEEEAEDSISSIIKNGTLKNYGDNLDYTIYGYNNNQISCYCQVELEGFESHEVIK